MQMKNRRVKALCALLVAVLAAGLLFGGEGADAKRRRRGGRGGRGGGGGVIVNPVIDPVADPAEDPVVDPAADPVVDPNGPADKPFTVEYVTQSGSVAPQQNVRVTADCPAGTRVLGGGASYSGRANQGMLNSSTPNPALSPEPSAGWSADITNTSDATHTLFVTAICGSGGHLDVQYVKSSVTVSPLSEGWASSLCPAGTQLTGGGGFHDGRPGSGHVNGSTVHGLLNPTQKSWLTFVHNVSADPSELTVTAICARAPGLAVQYIKSADTPLPAYQTASVSANCPPGTKTLGGGAIISQTSRQAYLSTSAPAAVPSQGWTMSAGNLGNTSPTVAATAICAAAA